MTDADDLARLCERLEKLAQTATPGPWELDRHPKGHTADLVKVGSNASAIAVKVWIDSAEYLAACDPQTVLSLIATLRRLQATIDTQEFIRVRLNVEGQQMAGEIHRTVSKALGVDPESLIDLSLPQMVQRLAATLDTVTAENVELKSRLALIEQVER